MSDLEQLKCDVDELVNPRRMPTSWVGPDKHNAKTADDPDLARRRAGGFAWPPPDDDSKHASLLDQLQRLRDGYTAVVNTGGGRSAPGSRLPAGSDVADLLVDITTGAADLYWRLLRKLGRQEQTAHYDRRSLASLSYHRPDAPRLVLAADELEVKHIVTEHGMPDRVDVITVRGLMKGYQTPPVAATLKAIALLVGDVDDQQLRRTAIKRIHSWVLAARLTLSYSAPMVALNMTCHYCAQQNLITRSDASSDVFCTTDGCVDDEGQQPRWPRSSWHELLTGAAWQALTGEETA